MQLSLVNFCKYESFTFTLPDTGIYCITGESGVGKTTILRAIIWCITGEGTDLVRHEVSAKARMSVTVNYNNMIIYRQKRPELLQVTLPDTTVYVDDTAQAYLHRMFGVPILWLSSTYLAQGETHPLVSFSAKERLELLQQAALSLEDPSPYIEAVQNHIKHLFNKCSTEFSAISAAINAINDESERIDFSCYYPPSERAEKLQKLAQYPAQQQKLQRRLAELYNTQGVLTAKKDRFATLKSNKNIDPNQADALLKEKNQLLLVQKEWQRYLADQKMREKQVDLERELSELHNKLPISDYNDIIKQQQILTVNISKWSQYSASAARLGIEYNKNTINHTVSKYMQLQQIRQYDDIKNKIKQYTTQADNIVIDENKLTNVDRNILTKEIYNATLMEQLLECPKCLTKLKYNNNKLEVNTNNIATQDLTALRRKLAEYDEQIALKTQKQQLQNTIHTLTKSIPMLPELHTLGLDSVVLALPVHSLEQKISQLKMIEVIEKPRYNMEQIQLAQKITHVKSQLSLFNTPVVIKPSTPMGEVETRLATVNEQLATYAKIKAEQIEYDKLMTEIAEMETALVALPNLQLEYDQVNNELTLLTQQSTIWPLIDDILARKADVEARSKELKAYEQELADWDQISRVMINEEFQLLEQTVGTINFVLDEIMHKLFSNLTAEILLYRTNKSNSLVKHEVNLCLKRTVNNGDNMEIIKLQSGAVGSMRLSSLSGGEKSRLNLALLLAFRAVTKSPWLFLDESLAFLNDDYCDLVGEIIKEHLTEIPGSCFIIMHRIVTGTFDQEFVIKK